jgi:nucleosome assembly protein 1-like 1
MSSDDQLSVAENENEPSLEAAMAEPPQENDSGDEQNDDEDEDEEMDNPLQHLPKYVIHRVERLRDLHDKRENIMAEYLAERAALENKFTALVTPLFQERNSIVQGEFDEQIATAHADKEPTEEVAEEGERVKGIPQFWLCAMMHNETVAELITEDDVDCLEKLCDITCIDQEDGKGFSLYFHFAPNDYFTNSVLTKTYDVPNLLLPDEPMLKNVKGTKIEWKTGRSLTFRMIKKKQRGKGKHAGHVRTVEKKEDVESFFRWFEPPEMPPMEELDEEEANRLEEIYDEDYEIAQAFRYQLIPQAVVYFTGEVGDEHVTLAMDGAEEDESE